MGQLEYTVSISDPQHHRIHVRLEVSGAPEPAQVVMPAWSPGSYMLREYARRIEHFRVTTAAGEPVPWQKVRKETWETEQHGGHFVVEYDMVAIERSPRMPYLDETFGQFTGVNTLVYVEGTTEWPARVMLDLPEGWKGYCSRIDGFVGTTYDTPDFDVLADTPVTFGADLELLRFQACGGVPHAVVVMGSDASVPLADFVPDIVKVLETTARYMGGGVPYPRYLFHLMLSESTRGGLEHLDSSVLVYPRLWLSQEDKYVNFMRLVAHEFFHVWNIKRIRTDALGPFDYRNENYTRELWVAEGWTSHIQFQILLWSGLLSKERFFDEIAQRIARHESLPARHIDDLESASFDAWVRFYRRDGDSANNAISYYLKGSLAALSLDLEILGRGDHQEGLRAVLGYLWERFAEKDWAYPEGSILAQIEAATGGDYASWLERSVRSSRPLELEQSLAHVGLEIIREDNDTVAGIGLRFESGTLISTVLRDGPGWRAGLMLGDEIIAVNRMRATASLLNEILESKRPGDTLELSYFRDGLLRNCSIELAQTMTCKATLQPVPQPTPEQSAALERWLQGP